MGDSAKLNESVGAVAATVTSTGGVAPAFRRAHVIVVGNEKGGSGKTTTTMHLMVALLRLGFSVGSIDLDSRQRSLTRYIENRRQTIAHEGIPLPTPQHYVIQKSPFDSSEEARADEKERFAKGLAKIYGSCDFVVIDTPGNDTYLSRLAHSFASTVITPINDSFVDLDVLAAVDGVTLNIVKPSIYSEMVWEQKLQRAKRDGGSIDWIVMRNRLSNLDARNKRFMSKVTEELARRIGFRVAPGFSERVIFREMFLQGLTVLDVLEGDGNKLSISHVAARQEVRNLLAVLKIPEIDRRIEKLRVGEEEAPTTFAPPADTVEDQVPMVAPSVAAAPKQAEAKLVETESPEAKMIDAKPVPAMPAESKPAATQAAEMKPAVVAPLADIKQPEKEPEEEAGFAIAREQNLPPAALVAAKAELARASTMRNRASFKQTAQTIGSEAKPEQSIATSPYVSKEGAALYPVLPTPSLVSGSPETRAPLIADPSLPATPPKEAVAPAPNPAMTGSKSEIDGIISAVRTGPMVPPVPPAVEAMKHLPNMSVPKPSAPGFVPLTAAASHIVPVTEPVKHGAAEKPLEKPSAPKSESGLDPAQALRAARLLSGALN